MKIRIKFRKYGIMKFIGHLDIMRYFQKAMRRADIDICYSSGFSPHMIMSFASPLGLGLESDGEYTPLPLQGIREFVILPDGERVAAIMRRDSSLRVFELNTGRECAVVAKDCFTVAVAADEKGFYYKVMEERSYIYTVYRINEDYSSTLIEEN